MVSVRVIRERRERSRRLRRSARAKRSGGEGRDLSDAFQKVAYFREIHVDRSISPYYHHVLSCVLFTVTYVYDFQVRMWIPARETGSERCETRGHNKTSEARGRRGAPRRNCFNP